MSIFAGMFHHFHDDGTHIKGQGSISSETLHRLLERLQAEYSILHPLEYSEKVLQGKLGPDEICLTFDDALKSQADIAFPVLQEHGLNAFFFVYSTALTGPPDPLEVFRDFRHRVFDSIDAFYIAFFDFFKKRLPSDYVIYMETYPEDYLSAFPFYTKMDRRFRFVRDNILSSNTYQSIMFTMMEETNYSIEEHSHKLFMTESDLHRLSEAGNIIGLHSNSHPTTIDKKSYSQQKEEYTENKRVLENCIGSEVWAMSHPCGRYNSETLAILQELEIKIGFRSSLSIRELKSPLEIPREDHSTLVKGLL